MNAPSKVTAVPPQVYAKIAAVQGDLAKQGIGKDSENTFDRYKFRGIDAVYNALAQQPGLYFDKLPPFKPTLLQLATRAALAQRDFDRVASGQIAANFGEAEQEEREAAEAFFAALEQETGIDRIMFAKLGGLA